ncbi:hypothetical protein [Sneathiella glossodoripedis]|uniref:hypothetical protein n=1 Tax=Sneathiella glossodoripedis TaxID=418853 RepID=UPI000472B5C0|nr:hypothetical protein [Sneathiella glossodoripedis]
MTYLKYALSWFHTKNTGTMRHLVVGDWKMRHKLIVCVTQLIAVMIGVGISLGILSLTTARECLVGGYGFCLLDTVLITVMGAIALISFAFAALLFKAYRIK